MADDNSFSKLFLDDKQKQSKKPKLKVVENKTVKLESTYNEIILDENLDHKQKLENLNQLLDMAMKLSKEAVELSEDLNDIKIYESTQNILKKTHDMNVAYLKQRMPPVNKTEMTVKTGTTETIQDTRKSLKDLL